MLFKSKTTKILRIEIEITAEESFKINTMLGNLRNIDMEAAITSAGGTPSEELVTEWKEMLENLKWMFPR